jgi:hypothetical protein
LVFLGCPSEDFGIVSALALAGRPRLAGRSSSGQRHKKLRAYADGAGILTGRPDYAAGDPTEVDEHADYVRFLGETADRLVLAYDSVLAMSSGATPGSASDG